VFILRFFYNGVILTHGTRVGLIPSTHNHAIPTHKQQKATCCTPTPHLIPSTLSHTIPTHKNEKSTCWTHSTFNSLYSQPHNTNTHTQSHMLHTHSIFNSLYSLPYNTNTHTQHEASCCTRTAHLIPSTHNHTIPTHTQSTKPPAAHSLHI